MDIDFGQLAFLAGNLIGLVLKRWAWYPTRYIPVALFAVNLLIQALRGSGVPVAPVAPAIAGLWGSLWPVLLNAALDTLKAIGLYEAARNAQRK